jgi:hypothetical protein
MSSITKWFKSHIYGETTHRLHVTAFLSMLITSFLMYYSVENALDILTWILLIIFIIGNILVLIAR